MDRLDFLGGSVSTRYHASGSIPRLSDGSISGIYKKEHAEVAGFEYAVGYAKVLAKSIPDDNNFTQIRQYGFGGLDTVFSPYSVYFSDENLPHFENPSDTTEPNSLTLNPFNPNNQLSLYYAPTGSLLYQASLATSGSPTAAESGLAGSTSGWLENGHTIEYASVGTGDFAGQPVDMNFANDFNSRGRVEVEHVRSVGFRAPLVLTGWGFDMDGNPVPANTGDSTQFHDDAFKDPTLWKSGPVDLRWDDERKVWRAGGTDTKIYLCKATNTINTSCFSYEVERDNTLSQYTRNTLGTRAFDGLAGETIYDPQNVAYTDDAENIGCRVSLDYDTIDAPMYEAFIIRQTTDPAGPTYYNLFSDDCSDCGSILESGCGTQHGDSAAGKKVLIENPLLQQIDVGTLMFTVNTGRTKNINTGEFSGGAGTGASGYVSIDADGAGSGVLTAAGSGYTYGAFALFESGGPCVDITMSDDSSGVLTGITIDPTTGLYPSGQYDLNIIPNDATVSTEELPIHWILNSQKFNTTVVTHVECQGGQLTKMTRKIQSEFQTCEIPNGSNTCAINSF
jgi:hypothetical protein